MRTLLEEMPLSGSYFDASGRQGNGLIAIRVLDITVAVLGILILLPMLILITIAVWIADPGPVFFSQRRIGRGGELFPCHKFRTMLVDAEALLEQILESDPEARREWQADRKLRRDPRTTALGRFLRRSSLDELPQLFNVLRGDMSIVGPRPIVPSERVLYGRFFNCYTSVKPGITGMWQISGRNDVSYRRRVALDVIYSRNKSLGLDLKILVMTIPAVAFSRGSY